MLPMHIANACPRDAKKSKKCLTELRARRVPHPADGPDLAPSDFFFFFGIMKTELQNYEIHSRQDLILAIWAIFEKIPKDILNSVYILWITRFK
jgi:hypothetical protein